MRIALISPKSSVLCRNIEFQKYFNNARELEFYRQYWSGLGSGLLILGALMPDNFKLTLIDENIDSIDFSIKYDFVALTAMTQQANRAYQIAQEFKRSHVPVIMGGIHATLLPDEAINYVDSVVEGEVENVWAGVLSDFKKNQLKPHYSSKSPFDLKKSPVPKYELLKDKPYKIIWVQSTRGCPHNCYFCSASKIYGPNYRKKKVSQVIEEIERIKIQNKHTLIGFADDNLFVNRKYANLLIDKIKQLKFRWIAQSDISVANDKAFVKRIKESGCVALFIGFESLRESNLNGLDKTNWKLRKWKNYEKYINIIQSEGIGIIGCFIVGFEHDDLSTFKELSNFIINNNLAGAQIAALTPFPRTRLRKQLLSQNRILDTPWENYTIYDVNFKPLNMSVKELQRGIINTFKKIYAPEVAKKKSVYFKNIFLKLHEQKIK